MTPSNPNLVVVRAGDQSLHPTWMLPHEKRSWDLVISYYGDDPDRYRSPGVMRVDHNCYTEFDARSQCHEHRYGAHIFHTNSDLIWKFVCQFGEMSGYRHRVIANNNGTLYTLPINLRTLYEIYGVCTPEEALARLEKARIVSATPGNLEEWALSSVGPEIYRVLIEGYSRKQWGRSPSELPASLIKRLPVRLSFNNDYFDDKYQGIPIEGYTKLFFRMIEGTPVELSTDFFADRTYWLGKSHHVVYTGPIDRYFDYDEGSLEYRTLKFERSYIEAEDFQGIAVVSNIACGDPGPSLIAMPSISHEQLYCR